MYVTCKRAMGWIGHPRNDGRRRSQLRGPCWSASGQTNNMVYGLRRYDAHKGFPARVVWTVKEGSAMRNAGRTFYSWSAMRLVQEHDVPEWERIQLANKMHRAITGDDLPPTLPTPPPPTLDDRLANMRAIYRNIGVGGGSVTATVTGGAGGGGTIPARPRGWR